MNNQLRAVRPTAPPKEAAKPEALPVGEILIGDALQRLRQLPDASIDTVITSPPYYALRDYGVDGQIGTEASVEGWVGHLAAVMAEVARVLKPGGSAWLNLADTYSRDDGYGAPPKSLLLGPERLALALSNAGWRIRNKVVWAKPNPMPSSVSDRLSNTWEPLLLLTRERHYFFDLDAIRVPARSQLSRPSVVGERTKYATEPGKRPAWSGPLAGSNSGLARMKAGGRASHPLGKNPGDVWTIPTAAYRGQHYATFPPALVERPLRATCPERVCRACGTPWRRTRFVQSVGSVATLGQLRKSCGCGDRRWQPGIVLDPFMGSGTVGVVADRLHRRWVGIELNPQYAALAVQRISDARGEAA